MSIECKHGHLARSCYRCDDEREIERLLAAIAARDRLLAMHEEFFVWRMCPETKTCPPWWSAARAQADERDGGDEFCIRYMRRAAQVMDETNATG